MGPNNSQMLLVAKVNGKLKWDHKAALLR